MRRHHKNFLIGIAMVTVFFVVLATNGKGAVSTRSNSSNSAQTQPWLADFLVGYGQSLPIKSGVHPFEIPVRNGVPFSHPRIKSVTVVLTLAPGERLAHSRFSVCCSNPAADKAKAAAQRFKRLPMLNGQRRFAWTVKDIVFAHSAAWLVWVTPAAAGQPSCVSTTAKPLGGPLQRASGCTPKPS